MKIVCRFFLFYRCKFTIRSKVKNSPVYFVYILSCIKFAVYVNKMSRLLCILFCLLALPSMSVAQAVVQFPKKMYDFGEVSEAADSVSCVFDVVNTGDGPLRIEGVYVSCGCTSATHSSEAIAPGEKGAVYVSFFPKNLDGRYLKSIYVYTNTLPRKNVVRIKARVVPKKED